LVDLKSGDTGGWGMQEIKLDICCDQEQEVG